MTRARPEGLTVEADPHGLGIVMTKTFLGPVTRILVRLDGDLTIQVDRPSEVASALDPGSAVDVRVLEKEVMVTDRRDPDSDGHEGQDAGGDAPSGSQTHNGREAVSWGALPSAG